MIRLLTLALGGMFLAGGVCAEATGDRAAGRKLAGQCRTCHGLDGYAKIPIAPHIGGEPVAYLANQLTAFRDGTREHEMMSVVSRGLSDQNIADLAAWYAGHKAEATLKKDDANAPEACTTCHGTDGLSLVDDAPNLAGESALYIDTQLKAFRGGKRTHAVMSEIAAELSDEEIRAVANWYQSVGLKIEQVD
jgi:cytochrome c553